MFVYAMYIICISKHQNISSIASCAFTTSTIFFC